MTKIAMGFDVGGTKTAAILVDSEGTVLGRGFGGSGNTNFIPLKIASQSFTDAVESARKMARIAKLKVDCVVVGTEPDPKPVVPVIKKLTGCARILHRKEGECSMVGGLVKKEGLALICGTGSVGWGRNAKGETSMTSCWGPIGDEGSAYDIARCGLNAAFWAWDGRAPKTILVDKLLTMFGKKDLRDICTPLYTGDNLRKGIADLARMVTASADECDRVSIAILKDCAEQVAHFLAACANNLKMGDKPYQVANAVSGLTRDTKSRYFKYINQALKSVNPGAKIVPAKFEPVVGAALIALDELGVEWTPKLVKNLEKSLAKVE